MSRYSPHFPVWHSNCTSPRLAWCPSSPSPLALHSHSETFHHNRFQYHTGNHVTAIFKYTRWNPKWFRRPRPFRTALFDAAQNKRNSAHSCKPFTSLVRPLPTLYYLNGSVHHHAADDLRLVGLLPLSSLSVTDHRSHIRPWRSRARLGNLLARQQVGKH